MKKTHTILGAGGAIGTELAKSLTKYTTDIRLVNRNPQKVNETDKLVVADVLKREELRQAIRDSEVVYVTIGFEYSTKIWSNTWPRFMKNLIELSKEENCKIVFFDNIYMYDNQDLSNITEEHKINPSSKKGKIRKEITNMLLDEIGKGTLKALIARSADFYGAGINKTCMLTETVWDPLSKGKKASWLGSDKFKHSFTYVKDAAEATALLGNTSDAYNQVWHLPTAKNPLTGKQWIESIAKVLNVKPKYQVAPKFLVRIMGWFVPIMGEFVEMMYQYDRDYVFNSDKFEKRFNFTPTSFEDGIKEIYELDYKK